MGSRPFASICHLWKTNSIVCAGEDQHFAWGSSMIPDFQTIIHTSSARQVWWWRNSEEIFVQQQILSFDNILSCTYAYLWMRIFVKLDIFAAVLSLQNICYQPTFSSIHVCSSTVKLWSTWRKLARNPIVKTKLHLFASGNLTWLDFRICNGTWQKRLQKFEPIMPKDRNNPNKVSSCCQHLRQ